MSKFKLTLMVGKALYKPLAKVINKNRKPTRDYRKAQASKTSKELATLNRAQERFETARDYSDASKKIMKYKKIPKEGRDAFDDAFKRVLKKRAKIRTILMDPKYLKTKKNKRGGFI